MNSKQIILGPGNHQNQLVIKLINDFDKLIVYNYYPKFSKTTYIDGKITSIEYSKPLNLIQWLIYGIGNRIKINQKHIEQLFYSIYDWYISLKIEPIDLIAWPQVSLLSIKKVKKHKKNIQLEYPMIHISEWQNIMKNEYKKLGIHKTKSIFPKTTEKRILQEIQLSDTINVLSSYAQNTFIKHNIKKEKITKSFLEIDPIFQLKNNSKIIKNNDKIIFLYVGRIEILKGVHLLLEAFSKLNKDNIELWLVGNNYPEMDFFINKYKQVNIIFLGQKTKEELINIYKQTHTLILPSLQESFGLVMLEAIHFGSNVIASSNTGANDISKKYPNKVSIFESGNINHLTKCLKIALKNQK